MAINDSGIEAPQRSAWPKSTREPNAQDPIAIVGMACRLPGENTSPTKLWEFLKRGGIASNKVPENRFSIKGHYDGSKKPGTMRPPGGMFLENIDLADFDASFFGISTAEAISMDPNQRQMLEVVYEAMENAGITLEQVSDAPVGCFIGSFASNYHDMQNRDPEDRPASIEIGIGRAILANRISHALNIKGPSPEHVMDTGPIRMAHSPTGYCHTFDIKADGYVKAEAVSSVILKRLDDAIRDGDPIRAIIRGSTTNSDGRTPGIASPNPVAQAAAVRTAYANAGIKDLGLTTYLECHGTGTQAGDPLEVKGVSSVFSQFRSEDSPLVIGSVKSNLGHSEPSAGLSAVLKVVLALEHGIIPGNPTFETPNPNIDFRGLRVRATRSAIPWPEAAFRRASINSFGYGGTNSHLILDDLAALEDVKPSHISSYVTGDEEDLLEAEEEYKPHIIVLSANSEQSLRGYVDALDQHLSNLEVKVDLPNLAYTLSERRSRHFHRAYAVVRSKDSIEPNAFTYGKLSSDAPKIGFIFTGQGAQWPQMGKELVETFPVAREILSQLDAALQELPTPPPWSLLNELVEARSAEHLRQPEFSQPLVTALQIVILEILQGWDIEATAVVGHSSGEIAASYAAGYITKEEAIKVAYYRGYSAKHSKSTGSTGVGMMAVGLGAVDATPYLEGLQDQVQIACYNSPKSVTLSGAVPALETVKERITKDGHFARLLQVDLAYHSKFMTEIGADYEKLLEKNFKPLESKNKAAVMFSSVTGDTMGATANARYWKDNMTSAVRFDEALQAMLSKSDAPNFLIEIGPSGALAGPVSQIRAALGAKANNVKYTKALNRGTDSILALYGVAGSLFVEGASISLTKVNQEADSPKPKVIFDLPNYVWNHSTKYWHENDASRDWRFRKYPHHDLLGTKVFGAPWHSPSFRKILKLEQLPWLRDHKMGTDILMPASGYISMAVEALYQTSQALQPVEGVERASQLCYRLRNVTFDKALVLEDNVDTKVMFTLTPHPGTGNPWYDFKVASSRGDDLWLTHCVGLIRLSDPAANEPASVEDVTPLKFPTPAHMWYKAQANIGYGFGPAFQKLIDVESLVGQRRSRATVSLEEPEAAHSPQSHYPLHPAVLDGCFQTTQPALRAGDRSALDSVVVPASIDELIINATDSRPTVGVSLGVAGYTGRGRKEEAKNYWSSCTVYDPEKRQLLMKLSGLRCHKLDTGIELHSQHTLSRTVWRPDISYLYDDQLISLARGSQPKIQDILDLVAHKSPRLRVFEVNLVPGDSSSLWFDDGDRSLRRAYSAYTLASSDAKSIINARADYEKNGQTSFELHDFAKSAFDAKEQKIDLALIKVSSLDENLAQLARNIRAILADGAIALFVESEAAADVDSDGSSVVVVGDKGSETEETNSFAANGFEKAATVSVDNGKRLHFVRAIQQEEQTKRHVSVIHLIPESRLSTGLKSTLRSEGWEVTEHSAPFADLEKDSILLILDDLVAPVLPTIEEAQWNSIKQLVLQGYRTLWVTEGSQMNVTKPNNALAHGLFRTIRAEDRGVSVTTLDVEYGESPSAFASINRVLNQVLKLNPQAPVEPEFVERGGIIYVNRVVPDEPVNQFKKAGQLGGEPVTKTLRDIRPVAMLRAERLGTLDALRYSEMSSEPVQVEPGMIEVELHASGLNFKDIAVTMGIVPENEHLLGLEGAGIVRRVGAGAEQFKIGDRVAILRNGTFANLIQTPVERAHKIPDWLSFEEAATIPLVYLTSIYSLFDIGGLKKGQSVLIHSAAGGIGLSSIQLAQWVGAEIYVTVSTEEKRQFLEKEFGIPRSRMFSSRDTQFASAILEITGGKGIDVIINSLTGELLDESWRICADGGVMVEIGKKDIVDRNYLSMEPFDRNCSFRAVDFSYKQVTDDIIQRLLAQTFQMVEDRHIKPILPITTYRFDDIPAAFAFMRSGKHIGKIVISDGQESASVPVRPATRKLALRADRSYIIVGGLKGLCGSLAVYLAREGAKHIIALSRSGCSDERSQKVIANCAALGCTVYDAAADVSDPKAVKSVFETAAVPVGGVIQGAMVLRDRPYETMTIDDFHTTIASKVQGTWNLHNAALAQKEPLEFFTLLSSISGVVGQKGQANYSAANVFLDAFSQHRRSLGLAAHSVDLGVIEDVGYVAEQGGMKQHFDDKQWTGINEAMLHRILFYSILQQTDTINKDSADQMITGIPVPQPADSDLAYDARFSLLFGSNEGGAALQGGNSDERDIQAFQLLRSSAPDHAVLLAAAVELTGAKFTKTLRLSDPIEPGKSLATYGLDSLSAVEFRNWVRLTLGAEITVLDITNASSLFALCEKIIAKLPK
ncbi:polyketide synthase [Trichoderma arundinaceum]|uniref:Polyketide synthase n=1 Tax=Trichoderma arundinaceum TaxID=490622 RepID=A0A395NQ76_TRIAR|nr:polyketide synthase [Trichoderma arundinaceum]